MNKKVLIKDDKLIKRKEEYTESKDLKYIRITSKGLLKEAEKKDCTFICGIDKKTKTPKFVFKKLKKYWILVDEYSGFFIHNKKIKSKTNIISVSQIIELMGEFDFNFSLVT